MRVCLDLSPVVHRKAGLATYAQRLAEQVLAQDLDDDYVAFHYDAHAEHALPPRLAALPQRVAPVSARPWRLGVALRYLLNRPMDAAFGGVLSGIDVFHATEHLLPLLAHSRSVFTFHDAIYALFPEHHLPLNRAFLGMMMPRFLRRADVIIAVSECSKRDAVRLYGIDPDRVHVIHEAADESLRPVSDAAELERVRVRHGISGDYLLYLGTIEPRKNLGVLLDAYHAFISGGAVPDPIPQLVIAGRKGWKYEPVFEKAAALGLSGKVIFPGYVPSADVAPLISGALGFVFPSQYEGFGLPPLEAMACGAPVICSNVSSLPEVVGDAAILVDPHEPRQIAQAMARVVADADLRAGLRAQGLRRAALFSWSRAAGETIALYHALRP